MNVNRFPSVFSRANDYVLQELRRYSHGYGVFIESSGQWHQATFFYESFANAILLCIMLLAYRRFKRKGYLLPMYMIGYGTIRFFVEGLRTDSLYLIPGLRVSQLLSLLLVVGGVIVALIRHSRENR